MARWLSITVDTLNERGIAAKIAACSQAAKAEGQPDRAPGIIASQVSNIRRKIASNPANRLDSDETMIPASLKDLASTFILAALQRALNLPLSPDQKDDLEQGRRELDRIADGRDTIEHPDLPVTPAVESTGDIETIEAGDTGLSAEDLRGL